MIRFGLLEGRLPVLSDHANDAPLILVEYGGLECPFCGRATGVAEELRERFGDELRYLFRHLPLPESYPHVDLAAEATEAAAAQGAFWASDVRLGQHDFRIQVADGQLEVARGRTNQPTRGSTPTRAR